MIGFKHDVCVIGGCGHVGLPLSIVLAHAGKKVCIQDINTEAIALIQSGMMPFLEEGAGNLLAEVLASGNLSLSDDPGVIRESEAIILIIGTPVDEFLNPRVSDIKKAMDDYYKWLVDGQLLVLRSTLYPGTSEMINGWLRDKGLQVDVTFCPERIAEGKAVQELRELPQIISAFTESGYRRARELFSKLSTDMIDLEPKEAEMAKLFTNSWRYLKFSIANQFYMIANDYGVDYYKVHHAMTRNYPRAIDIPKPGFAAGPCLFKDTMQLAAFYGNNFYLGHAAMLVNEGMPNYIVRSLKRTHDISGKTIGILGMAFKANSDDKRSSLSYKLRKILETECREVLCTDVYIKDPSFVSIDEVIERADLLILGAAHREYASIDTHGKEIVDIWNFYDRGAKI